MSLDLLLEEMSPPWMLQAACKGMTEVMFLGDHNNRKNRRRAREICLRCTVRIECDEYGRDERHGTWGGHAKENP